MIVSIDLFYIFDDLFLWDIDFEILSTHWYYSDMFCGLPVNWFALKLISNLIKINTN
jgi:hypothetical protein